MPCVAEVVNRSLKADCTDFNIFFRADNYAVDKEILVNKYCTKASRLSETQSSHCRRITALIIGMIQNVFDTM